jgi:hypothetical protein
MSAVLIAEAAARYPMHTTAGRDHKAWAKRFIYREERGDKTLLSIQIKFAKMAMEIKEEAPA